MKESQLFYRLLKQVAPKSMVLLFCMLLSFAGIAQDSRVAANGNDPMLEYLQKHKDSQLVKMYQQHSNDAQLAQAIRYAMILENPEKFPDFGSIEIENMKANLNALNTDLKLIDTYMQEGVSYEMAKQRLDQSQEKVNLRQQNSNVPTLQKAD